MALKMKLHFHTLLRRHVFAAMSIRLYSTGGSKLVENTETELDDGDSDGHDHDREAHHDGLTTTKTAITKATEIQEVTRNACRI